MFRGRVASSLVILALFSMTACKTTTSQKAPQLTPVSVKAFEETKPIAFRKIVLKVPRNKAIGSVQVGWLCIKRGDFRLSGGRNTLNSDRFNEIFREQLQLANYKVVGDPDALFGDPELKSAEYFVAGLVTNVEANVC